MLTSDGADNFKPKGFLPVREAFGWSDQLTKYLRERNWLYTGEDESESMQGSPQKDSDARFKYLVSEVTKAAFHREIRRALYDGKITGSILTSDGKLIEIPSEIWGSASFASIVETGHAALNVGSNRIKGRALIRNDELKAFCDSWYASRPARKKERAAKDAAGPEKTDTVEDRTGYVPPYLAFMLRAAQELGLSESRRAPKEVVESWLREHWPSDFGVPTRNKISYMATLLRHPGDEKGGHFKPERTKT
jgi:hypothetical protein